VICTPLSALWCPLCGQCSCTRVRREHGYACGWDNPLCPLHGANSGHADNQRLVEAEGFVDRMAARQGVTLTGEDRSIVARFTQWLLERSGKDKSQ
jgi:hypothetical protein